MNNIEIKRKSNDLAKICESSFDGTLTPAIRRSQRLLFIHTQSRRTHRLKRQQISTKWTTPIYQQSPYENINYAQKSKLRVRKNNTYMKQRQISGSFLRSTRSNQTKKKTLAFQDKLKKTPFCAAIQSQTVKLSVAETETGECRGKTKGI